MVRPLLALLAAVVLSAPPVPHSPGILRAHRTSPGDLEVGGELAGLPPGSTRYIPYQDLQRLPQEKYTVTDDSNFKGPTQIEGVPLEALVHLLGDAPNDALIVAICYDHYRTNYPQAYLAAHHPLLVLRINGQLRDHWPPSEYGGSMQPYLISHPFFKPAFKILSHEDEPQIPFGVTRLEIRHESVVFGAIRPRGQWPENSAVEQGYEIARQDCFRCHNMGAEGGTLANRSWLKLAAVASSNAARFRRIIRDPASVTPGAKMPAHKDYDDATLDALTAYFSTFAIPRSQP
jgi:cytochrome c2